MINKKNERAERFSLKLTINDNIICQRYFNIDNFDVNSKGSVELIETLNNSVTLIQNDLNSKTRIYAWYTAPRIFNNENEFNQWVTNPNNLKSLDVGQNISLKDNKTHDYYWTGEQLKQHTSAKYETEHEKGIVEEPTFLKLIILDGEKEMCSRMWDASVYPRFIRNAIDISNYKGRSNFDPNFMRFEEALSYKMSVEKDNLIGVIIRLFQDTCRYSKNYGFTKLQNYITDKSVQSLAKTSSNARNTISLN